MLNARFAELQILYRKTLLEDVIPFWEKYSIDRECGGYYTCFNRNGTVFDTDKFIWLQARQVWMFSVLYNRMEKQDNWREIARHGADFLRKHGMDEDGNWYFSLTREGQPLVQSYNIFSDCFAAMAFSQYSLACGDKDAKQIADRTYRSILRRKDNPKGKYNKVVSGTRPMVSLGLPMILSNLTLELEWMLDTETFNQAVEMCHKEIFSVFLDQKNQILREHVAPDSSPVDCFEGRLINPGHGIEAMWFIMDIARQRNDTATIKKAVDVILNTLKFGWDKKHGGIFYFLDIEEHPPQQLEWDQKLWWVHLETLVALAMAYSLTGRSECWEWYEKVHQYTWQKFPDPKYGEWFGYLNRQGEVLLPLKGGKWKGCFHLPRALYLCSKLFSEMQEKP